MMSRTGATPLRFGIIGAGSIAAYHVNGLRSAGGAEVVAIATRSQDTAQQAATALTIAHACSDWRALLERKDLDAVIVATPDETHRKIACAALAAGLHVLVQKPMALTIADCSAMIAAAQGAPGLLGVSFMHRHFQEVVETRRLLADSSAGLGKVLSARLRNATAGPDWNEWFFRGAQGGVVMQLGVHGIDLVQHLFGPIGTVIAQTALRKPQRRLRDGRIIEPDNEDHAFAIYTLGNGMLLSHEMCFAEPAGTDRFALEIVTENAVVHLRGPRGPLAIRRAGETTWQTPPCSQEPLGQRQHRAFLAMLRREVPEDDTASSGLAGIAVAEAIYRSAATGASITFAPNEPQVAEAML